MIVWVCKIPFVSILLFSAQFEVYFVIAGDQYLLELLFGLLCPGLIRSVLMTQLRCVDPNEPDVAPICKF
jgi:hypothetical protein